MISPYFFKAIRFADGLSSTTCLQMLRSTRLHSAPIRYSRHRLIDLHRARDQRFKENLKANRSTDIAGNPPEA